MIALLIVLLYVGAGGWLGLRWARVYYVREAPTWYSAEGRRFAATEAVGVAALSVAFWPLIGLALIFGHFVRGAVPEIVMEDNRQRLEQQKREIAQQELRLSELDAQTRAITGRGIMP